MMSQVKGCALHYTKDGVFRNSLETDPNLKILAQSMEECSGEYRLECDSCPAAGLCQKWWNRVCHRYSTRVVRDADMAILVAKFEDIKIKKGLQPCLL